MTQRKLRHGIKTYLEQNFLSIVKFKKLGFSAPLIPTIKMESRYQKSKHNTLYKIIFYTRSIPFFW